MHEASFEERERQVDAWLAQCTLEEKLALLAGTGFDTVGVPRLGIPKLAMADGPVGLRAGESTAFPATILLAASFDPALVQRVGAALGREAKAHGKNVLLAPCVNLLRVPHGGRNFESFGEDPCLGSRAAVAYIRGVQSERVVATVKHFAANNQETDRLTVSVALDERALHELYLPAFEASVKEAGVWAVMGAYNRLNGIYACEHPTLLGDVLKRRWGFQGLVMTDWWAAHSTAPSLRAGLDLEMPKGQHLSPDRLAQALEQGEITLSNVDDAVRRQLRVLVAIGYPEHQPDRGALDTLEHRALNREAARSGFVLLKNRQRTLPLDRNALRRLAVIGPRAAHVAGGGGSAGVRPTRTVSLVAALREALGSAVVVDYAPGVLPPEDLELVPPEVLSPPTGQGDGMGLLGEYSQASRPDRAPALVRVDEKIDFRWWHRGPAPEVPLDDLLMVWRGRLTPRASGRYALGFVLSGSARLWVDGRLLLEHAGSGPAATARTADIDLVAGRVYELRVEHRETGLEATVFSLRWCKTDRDLAAAARTAAASADAVVLCVGHTEMDETEGRDRPHLELPAEQVELIHAVAKLNSRTVVVLGVGAPVLMGEWLPGVPSVLLSWFTGQEGGYALADVLLGDVSPSGKLPVTFPKRWEDCPAYGRFPGEDGTVRYDESLLVGYRWFDARQVDPEFPFGHGLSYAEFAYSGLVAEPGATAGQVRARVTVQNTGTRPGSEVVQVYLHALAPPLPRPDQELKAFGKVELAPGEAKEVVLELEPRAFSSYDPEARDWVLYPGEFELRVGASSRDIRLRTRVRVG